MRSKIGITLMVLGTVLILGALSLVLYNHNEAARAAEASQKVMPELVQQIQERYQNSTDENSTHTIPNYYDPTMTEVEIDGFAYVGYLYIPSLELELPVMSTCDETRLQYAPCRYSGSTKTDDLVIAAHNYYGHFANLYQLETGAEVIFTDMDGVVSKYDVIAIDTLQPTDVAEMVAGDYDLTLFTCTFGGQSRVTVRCDYQKNPSDSEKAE